MDRVTGGAGTNVVMVHHREEDEGGPNRVVGEEEAVDETGIEEGIGTGIGTGEIGREILVGQREVGEEVVLDGVNALGLEKPSESQLQLRRFENGWTPSGGRRFVAALVFIFTSLQKYNATNCQKDRYSVNLPV